MTSSHSSFLRYIQRGAAIAALFSFMASAPNMAAASTICEVGRITLLEHRGGGNSQITFKTDKSPAATGLIYPFMSKSIVRGTTMWYEDDVRWRDRLSFLRSAYALQLPIFVTSSDNNCMGPSDEFTITLCSEATSASCK